jgi:hypothetical protein
MNRFDEWFYGLTEQYQKRLKFAWGIKSWEDLNWEDKEDIYFSESGEMTPEGQEAKYWDDKIDEARLEGR